MLILLSTHINIPVVIVEFVVTDTKIETIPIAKLFRIKNNCIYVV